MPEINLHLGHCLEAMRGMKDKQYVLAIVDPPYGIGQDGRTNHTRSCLAKAKSYRQNTKYDNQPPPEEFFTELRRVSNHYIVWGANHFISRIAIDSPCWIVWDKNNGENDFADC